MQHTRDWPFEIIYRFQLFHFVFSGPERVGIPSLKPQPTLMSCQRRTDQGRTAKVRPRCRPRPRGGNGSRYQDAGASQSVPADLQAGPAAPCTENGPRSGAQTFTAPSATSRALQSGRAARPAGSGSSEEPLKKRSARQSRYATCALDDWRF